MKPKVASFGIFDTCLVRNLAKSTDLFYFLAKKSFSKYYQGTISDAILLEIAQCRIDAESAARAATTKEDITLAEIYKQAQLLLKYGIDPTDMLKDELKLEKQSLKPIAKIKHLIQERRNEGYKIIFASDTYLPSDFIRNLLLTYEIALGSDVVYVSNELSFIKRTGNLFRYILEKEDLPATNLHHTGNNLRSDFIVPKRLGIKVSLFRDAHFNRYEQQILSHKPTNPWILSQIAGTTRVTRLMAPISTEPKLTYVPAIAANVIAPLLTSFITWVSQQAKEFGIERLYFVARDGHIMLKIASEIKSIVGLPECRYLYGSRQAWSLPSVLSVDKEQLEFLIVPGQSTSLNHLLAKLEIDLAEIIDVLPNFGLYQKNAQAELDEEEIAKFWRLLKHPKVSTLILQKATIARKKLIKYLQQEELLKDTRWAIVDAGWTARTQESLRRILVAEGVNYIQYFYLGLTQHRISTIQAGSYVGFLIEEFERQRFSALKYLFVNRGLIDQIFVMTDHGSTIRYKEHSGQVHPVLGKWVDITYRKDYVELLHESTKLYASELAKTGVLQNHSNDYLTCTLNNVGLFLKSPLKSETKTLAWAPISDDPNEQSYVRLAKRLTILDLMLLCLNIVKRGLGFNYSSKIFHKELGWGFSWLEGSITLSNIFVKMVYTVFRRLQKIHQKKDKGLF